MNEDQGRSAGGSESRGGNLDYADSRGGADGVKGGVPVSGACDSAGSDVENPAANCARAGRSNGKGESW